MTTDIVTRLIPDLDDELCDALAQVEEVLLTLAAWETDPDDPVELPAPLARRVALEALNRVQDAITPTQSRNDQPASAGGRMLGPDARHEHRPLRLVSVSTGDLALLADTAALLGRSAAGAGPGDVAEALAARASAETTSAQRVEPADLVAALARALGVLDLATTDDSTLLTGLIADTAANEDIVLDLASEAAYQRTADRLNAMWADRRGLDRWLY